MTKNYSNRQHIVNTMCTNTIIFCQAHPSFNTSSHTNKSLKSDDRPDGLKHKKSHSGRETLPLCPQLGIDYPRQMGLAGNHRVELTQTSHQARQSLEISCSLEEQTKISQEVMELLAKGAIIEARPSPLSYVSQIFLVEKKGGGDKGLL